MKVTVQVFSPQGRPLVNVRERQQGIIRFDSKQPGLYTFKITAMQPCKVTLALETPVEENFDDIHEDLLLKNPDWASAWFENKQNDGV